MLADLSKLELFILCSIFSTNDNEQVDWILYEINDPKWIAVKENGGKLYTKDDVKRVLVNLRKRGFVECFKEDWDFNLKHGKLNKLERSLESISDEDEKYLWFGLTNNGQGCWELLKRLYPSDDLYNTSSTDERCDVPK